VSVLRGSAARIRILDSSATGHLNVDDFRFTDLAPTDQTVMIGATSYPAVVQDPSGVYCDWDSPVWGFADLHAHPMSCLGFGWKVLHGAPDGAVFDPTHGPDDITNALSNCNPDHGGWVLFDNPSGDYVRNWVINGTDPGGYNPHTEGWDNAQMVRFRQWPVFDSITHQQMWYEWIKRAYDGGQRVMVALAVNNERPCPARRSNQRRSADRRDDGIRRAPQRFHGDRPRSRRTSQHRSQQYDGHHPRLRTR
jgi:hypothetical protein